MNRCHLQLEPRTPEWKSYAFNETQNPKNMTQNKNLRNMAVRRRPLSLCLGHNFHHLRTFAFNGSDRDEEGALGLGAGARRRNSSVVQDLLRDQHVGFGEGADVAMEGVENGEKAGADVQGDEGLQEKVLGFLHENTRNWSSPIQFGQLVYTQRKTQ